MSSPEQIRTRRIYMLFEEWYRFLKRNPKPFTILQKLYKMLDDRHCYGSEAMSLFAEESLEQLMKDKDN